ncbi:MAG: hypothetical protein LBL09_01845 [Oscillospiraceae bacterium]|jgi:hypothetical protein|nr:hypothetical protein [Oscillospiraceae bacterium]
MILCFFLIAVTSCDNAKEKLKEKLSVSEFVIEQENPQVKLTIEYDTFEIGSDEIIVTVKNITGEQNEAYGKTILVGAYPEHYIEIEMDGDWYQLGLKHNVVWNDFGAALRWGEEFHTTIQLDIWDFEWIEGHYRIVMPISGRFYSVEFEMIK